METNGLCCGRARQVARKQTHLNERQHPAKPHEVEGRRGLWDVLIAECCWKAASAFIASLSLHLHKLCDVSFRHREREELQMCE